MKLILNLTKHTIFALTISLLLSATICLKQNAPAAAAPAAPATPATPATPAATPATPATPATTPATPAATAQVGLQATAFPNTNEAPTMNAQLGQNNNFPLLISNSLREIDPLKSLRKHEFVEELRYGLHQLTRGEAELIFHFVDVDKTDTITQKEWDAFTTVFVYPFEACDKNSNKFLDEAEFKLCFESDPRSRYVEFRKRYETTKYGLIMDTISTRGTRQINFADYLFVRKALHGWKECHSHLVYIAKDHFRCALDSAMPNKYNLKLDIERIYNVGLDISADRTLIELDFLAYLRVSYFTYVFTVFATPYDTPYLEKNQWLKAIKEDRLPNNFEESEVDTIFELINISPTVPVSQIDFASWCFFFNLHKLFYQYSLTKPLQLSKDEFIKLLEDPFISKEIVMAIDGSATNFTEPQYQEASLILKQQRLNEDHFFKFKEQDDASKTGEIAKGDDFPRFKQDASVTTALTKDEKGALANYYEIIPNKDDREVFFTSIADIDKNFILKKNFFRGLQLANLYVSILGKCTRTRPIPVSWFIEKLPKLYDTIVPPISIMQRKNISYYKNLPGEIYIDLLTFIALENFEFKIKVYTMSNSMYVNETVLKIILQDFGMHNMPDTVLDTAQKEFDAIRRRQYGTDVVKSLILVQAAASEKARADKAIIDRNIKTTGDDSRKYPQLNRRQPISRQV
jgi:hypothetical protein